MSDHVNFYMEPVRFFNQPQFLAGLTTVLPQYSVINNKDEALQLLFSQHLPAGYRIWDDFFAEQVGALILDVNYEQADENIQQHIRLAASDDMKAQIRKRKAYLLKKKAGLTENVEYDDFISETSDECHYMLMMVSVQRYLKGLQTGSVLETVFDILKAGALPCGVKESSAALVIFDPAVLKSKCL